MKIGDKIVCVDDNIKSGLLEFVGYAYPNWIKKDKIYTGIWLQHYKSSIISPGNKPLGKLIENAFS